MQMVQSCTRLLSQVLANSRHVMPRCAGVAQYRRSKLSVIFSETRMRWTCTSLSGGVARQQHITHAHESPFYQYAEFPRPLANTYGGKKYSRILPGQTMNILLQGNGTLTTISCLTGELIGSRTVQTYSVRPLSVTTVTDHNGVRRVNVSLGSLAQYLEQSSWTKVAGVSQHWHVIITAAACWSEKSTSTVCTSRSTRRARAWYRHSLDQQQRHYQSCNMAISHRV
jgi:hypothetical protein